MIRYFFIILFITTLLFSQNIIPNENDSNNVIKQSKISELRSELDDIFSDPNFVNAFWGASIYSLKTGETIYKLNTDKSFKPGSVLKLFTTSTALLLLGPDYKFKTTFFTDGKIINGVLEGNLIIVGFGDPTITSGDGKENDDFKSWIDSLNHQGIYSIKGDLILYDDNFETSMYGKSLVARYDYNCSSPYSGSFVLNENNYEIILEPTEPGSLSKVFFTLFGKKYSIINNVFTNSKIKENQIEYKVEDNNKIIIDGQISLNSDPHFIKIPINNPSQFFANAFYEVLVEEGLVVKGSAKTNSKLGKQFDFNELTYLFEDHSARLTEIVAEINKNSNNVYAEQLLKAIGYELFGYGSTKNGLIAIEKIIQQMGINPTNIQIVDGSGVSPINLITPNQVTKLLSYMYKSDSFEEFYKSLSIAGFDGTLIERMGKSKAENNFRGKSGYLENVRSLAGYIKTTDNEPIALVLIANNFLVPAQLASYVQDKICNLLANFTRN
ncbi:MAG: D-alanyl-D-alanine carboxypeptidase/D-alanyl-D-alanine-endopeptidase [Melioribacteraceae bacterium]|nr:MAG: D-alanyl-D-alanine carboxypeptidase/D-alanyl-D-alanine-endopeptidase [Melioribacteraceae bacterium]